MMEIFTKITNSEEETIKFGTKFAERLIPGDLVAIEGDLGSGKTQFIKGICNYFNVNDIVTSPTFTIMNQYFGTIDNKEIPIYHIDLYRIKFLKELEEIGFSECVYANNGIKLVEWAEKANHLLPDNGYFIKIHFNEQNENERIFKITHIT